MATDLEQLSEKELEARAAVAHRAHVSIIQRLVELNRGWLELAAEVYEFQSQGRHRDLGYRSFSAWLSDPDVDLEARQAYHLIRAYEAFVVDGGKTVRELDGVKISKARTVAPAIERGEVGVDEAIADCKVLSVDDLQVKYRPGGDPHEPIDASRGGPIVLGPEPGDVPVTPRCESCGQPIITPLAQSRTAGGDS